MKLAITSQNRKTITEHAGMCRKFWVYDIQDQAVVGKELVELEKDQTFHEITHAPAPRPHPLDGISVLITAGAGLGMQRKLAQRGIRVLLTSATDPDGAVADWLRGTLPASTQPEHECSDDHHHHHHH